MRNLRFGISDLLMLSFVAAICLSAPDYGGFWLAFFIGTLTRNIELSWPRLLLLIFSGGTVAVAWIYAYQLILNTYPIKIPRYTLFGGVYMNSFGLAFGLLLNFLFGTEEKTQEPERDE